MLSSGGAGEAVTIGIEPGALLTGGGFGASGVEGAVQGGELSIGHIVGIFWGARDCAPN